jgi:nitrogenase subunit NifH
MDKNMKRKQFHLSIAEEKIIYEVAKKKNISEAEVVRMAIREYGEKNVNQENSLIQMAKAAQLNEMKTHTDLSLHHDKYLAGEIQDE